MRKSIAIIMAMSGLSVFLFLSSGCYAKSAEKTKSGNVNSAPARKVAKAGIKVKAMKTEKIVKVIGINGSNITYALGEGKKEKVKASSFPGSMKVGDVVTVTSDNGLVTIAKYYGMKMPIGC